MSETRRAPSLRRGALVAVYLFAAASGYLVGSRGFRTSDGPAAATHASARVGLALGHDDARAIPNDGTALGSDLAVVRAMYPAPQREVLDLVVAVRGLENQGHPDWAKAEERCRALGWPRCDHVALEELRKRSHP